MIRLAEAKHKDRELLWNILQKYLHEMTAYYGMEMDEKGDYSYRYFDAYFCEPERKALLIYSDEHLAGFAMINPHSYIGETPDHVLAEFTVFPMYRKNRIGAEAAEYILQSFPGRWEIKYCRKNAAAKGLWERVTARYNPVSHSCGDDEVVLSFSTI